MDASLSAVGLRSEHQSAATPNPTPSLLTGLLLLPPPPLASELSRSLACLARFGETVTLLALPHELVLTTLSPAKSAHAKVAFGADFFAGWSLVPGAPRKGVTCDLNIKASRPSAPAQLTREETLTRLPSLLLLRPARRRSSASSASGRARSSRHASSASAIASRWSPPALAAGRVGRPSASVDEPRLRPATTTTKAAARRVRTSLKTVERVAGRSSSPASRSGSRFQVRVRGADRSGRLPGQDQPSSDRAACLLQLRAFRVAPVEDLC
jgi:hypothetical protein